MHQVSIIGSGHVAHHFIQFFNESEHFELKQVYARQYVNIETLVEKEKHVSNLALLTTVDFLLICVSDVAIQSISEQIQLKNTLIIHTSGSQSIEVLKKHKNYGMLYPLQTFSKHKAVDFNQIPLCIEANDNGNFTLLKAIAHKISTKVYDISSEQRKILHLSAVFVCNFANHLYHIGADLCEQYQMPFDMLQPLIEETANKIKYLHPKKAQTGPAIRGDDNTMQAHLELLTNNEQKILYTLLSKMIKAHEL